MSSMRTTSCPIEDKLCTARVLAEEDAANGLEPEIRKPIVIELDDDGNVVVEPKPVDYKEEPVDEKPVDEEPVDEKPDEEPEEPVDDEKPKKRSHGAGPRRAGKKAK